MARKTKEEAMETRNAILDAAAQILSAKGVANTSLEDIARAAGVTRGAIYWHFANKADLLRSLWEQILILYLPDAPSIESRDEPDPLGKLKALCLTFLAGLVDDPRQQQLMRILFDRNGGSDGAETICQYHHDFHAARYEHIRAVLRNAADKRQLPEDFDVHRGAIAVIAYLHGLIAYWFILPDVVDLKREAPALVEGMLRMLRTGLAPASA